MTPFPFARVVDLDAGSPMEDKYVVQVYGCDGKYSLWYAGKWRKPDALPLQPGDRILAEWQTGSEFRPPANLPPAEALPLPTPASPSLEYDPSPDALLVEGVTSYSGLPFGPGSPSYCNYLPDLRIWGDGMVVYAPPPHMGVGSHKVFVGQLEKEKLVQILELFNQHKFFAPWVWGPMVSTVGGGFSLKIHIRAGDYYSYDSAVLDLYNQMLALIDVAGLPAYTPTKALLKIGSLHTQPYAPIPVPSQTSQPGYLNPDLPGNPLDWPAQLGFAPSDVGVGGREIEGPGLTALWDQILASTRSDPVWKDAANKQYKVWLEIPRVNQPLDPQRCTATQVPKYPPGYKPPIYPAPQYPAPQPHPTYTLWPGYPAPLPTMTPIRGDQISPGPTRVYPAPSQRP
jgi:hypothetical protein